MPFKWSIRVDQQRAEHPVPSRVSMKSERSMGKPMNFRDGQHSTEQRFDFIPVGFILGTVV